MKFLAGILGVVKQQLAWCELTPIDIFILPHVVHELLGPKVVCILEGACHNIHRSEGGREGDTS